MDIKEIKVLLKLLGQPSYRSTITNLKPNEKTSTSERDKICRDLGDRELVACTEEIRKIKITSPGKTLLKASLTDLPLAPDELKILQACEKTTVAPSQIKINPAKTRDELIENLSERGLITPTEKKLKEVWLTAKGKHFLAQEYAPSGKGNITLTKNMIADYLRFIRSYQLSSPQANHNGHLTPAVSPQLSNEDILQTILDLDRQLGTDNYLPIFHLRQKLQSLSRNELDKALYRLEEEDKIELSTIVEVSAYSSEELAAGISQPIGGSLFFITVK